MSEQHHGPGPADVPEVDAEQARPEQARSERAGETPPHEDAEAMEAALREGGPLAGDPHEKQRRERPLDEGGTSLT